MEEGILYKKRGIGMFVSPGAAEKIRNRRKEEFYNQKIRELLDEAKRLGITKAELIDQINKRGEEK